MKYLLREKKKDIETFGKNTNKLKNDFMKWSQKAIVTYAKDKDKKATEKSNT